VDGNGDPVPSRWADDAELLALCRVVSGHPGTTLEYIPGGSPADAEVARRMTAMSRTGKRMLNWNLLTVDASRAAELQETLLASDTAADHGARFLGVALPVPLQIHLSFAQGCILETLPGWEAVRASLPVSERIRAFEDPVVRSTLKQALDQRPIWAFDYGQYLIETVDAPSNRAFAGRFVADIAAERRQDPFDAFIDIIVRDRLQTRFATPKHGDDPASWSLRIATCLDPRVIVGGSDAGAHGADLDSFNLYTDFVGPSVRDRGLLSLEDAVRRVTMDLATEFGVVRRGQVREGFYADLLVFDPAEIGPGPSEFRADMPAGGERLYAEARGMSHVIVNGTSIIDHGEFTDEVPGTLLRSGRDTATVLVGGDER
jgi:N-acyl-D-aspartate/D-glutamate deacylase